MSKQRKAPHWAFEDFAAKLDQAEKEDWLELWVRQNKAELDLLHAPATSWKAITAQLPEQKTAKVVPLRLVWQVAASFLLLLSAAVGLLVMQNQQLEKAALALTETEVANPLSVELQQAEQYYYQQISLKEAELKKLAPKQEQLLNSFKKEAERLELNYQKIKADMKAYGSNPQLIQAMIVNLQLRIALLNRQKEILQQLNKTSNEIN